VEAIAGKSLFVDAFVAREEMLAKEIFFVFRATRVKVASSRIPAFELSRGLAPFEDLLIRYMLSI
jgi:hypothetical protein